MSNRKAPPRATPVSRPNSLLGTKSENVRAIQGDSTLSGVLEVGSRNGRRMLDGSATVTHVEYPEIAAASRFRLEND